jgi:hypothetical protein
MTRRRTMTTTDLPEVTQPKLPRIIAGADLAPVRNAPLAEEQFWFWLGALHEAPRESFHVAGLEFPKVGDIVFKKRGDVQIQDRMMHLGTILRLSRARLLQLGAALPRKIVRPVWWKKSRGDVGDDDRSRAPLMQGSILSINTPEDIAKAHNNGRVMRSHTPQAGDVPIARYLYAVWLDEVSPSMRPVSSPMPLPLSETGLVIPPEGARAVPEDEQINTARGDGYYAVR